MQTRLRLFAQIVCFFVGTNDSGFSCWQGVQELQMRMGHAPGVEGFMPNMQHAQVSLWFEEMEDSNRNLCSLNNGEHSHNGEHSLF